MMKTWNTIFLALLLLTALCLSSSFGQGIKHTLATQPLLLQGSDQTLIKDGCEHFLGRADEYLCKTEQSYHSCMNYLKQGTAKFCAWAGHQDSVAKIGKPEEVASALKSRGCKELKAGGGVWDCSTNMGYTICQTYMRGKVVMSCINDATPSPAVPASNSSLITQPSVAQAYGLGVSMGFASFQSLATANLDDSGTAPTSYTLAEDALTQAKGFATQLNGSVPKLNVAALAEMIKNLSFNQPQGKGWTWHGAISDVAARIVPTRSEYSATIHKVSKRAGDAYDLGVAISIAEAQATAGEPARQIVKSSLQAAVTPALGLGFNAKEILDIVIQIDQGAPMDGIYGQVQTLRGKYQGSL